MTTLLLSALIMLLPSTTAMRVHFPTPTTAGALAGASASALLGVAVTGSLLHGPALMAPTELTASIDSFSTLGYALLPCAIVAIEQWSSAPKPGTGRTDAIVMHEPAVNLHDITLHDVGKVHDILDIDVEGVDIDDEPEPMPAATVCFPIEFECDACELNEEFSAYYGEEVWLCSN